MRIPGRPRSEEQFAASQKKAKQALAEMEKVRQERTDHIAKLKAQRLAKESADAEAAGNADAEKTAAKSNKNKTSSTLPQAHRPRS